LLVVCLFKRFMVGGWAKSWSKMNLVVAAIYVEWDCRVMVVAELGLV
jgi:hypothetical protein